jgi:hypothetical protein
MSAKQLEQVAAIDVDPFWLPLVPREFPVRGDLARRVPVPVFGGLVVHSNDVWVRFWVDKMR